MVPGGIPGRNVEGSQVEIRGFIRRDERILADHADALQEPLLLRPHRLVHVVAVLTGYDDLDDLLGMLERMSHHLTAAVVSADPVFQQKVLGATVNGTTYCGMRARTTGAPQNHWFGPSGDPRGAGIGTPEAIQVTWSAHREIIADQGPLPEDWSIPPLR